MKTWNDIAREESDEPARVCVCKDCGKKFNEGDEGDNDEYCLRCEYLSLMSDESEGDFYDDEDALAARLGHEFERREP